MHQYRIGKWRAAAGVGLIALTSQICSQVIAINRHESSEICARFDNEALEAWKQLEESLASISGKAQKTFQSEVTSPEEEGFGKVVTLRKSIEFWVRPEATKVAIDHYNENGKWVSRKVLCRNPEYSFIAEQTNQEGEYILNKCGYTSAVQDDIDFSMKLQAIRSLNGSFGIESDLRTLPQILTANSTELTSCRVTDGTKKLVEIRLRFHPVGLAAEQDDSIRETVIRLDPSARWRVISSATHRAKEDSTFEVDYTFRDGPHIAQINRYERTSVYPKARIKEIVSYSDINYGSVPIEEFYLTYYGLPECSNFVAPSFGYVRLAMIGITLFVIGVLLRAVVKKRQVYG